MSDSSLSRVVNVLFSPTTTFEAIRRRPTWLVALVILVVLGLAGAYLVTGKMDIEEVVRESVADSGRQLSEDQLEQAIALQEKLLPVFAIAGPLVIFPVACLLMALLFWVALRLLGGEMTYQTSFSTTVHGLMPNAVSSLLTLPVVMSRGALSYEEVRSGSVLASNLGFFASEETSTAVRTLLAGIDVFTIWALILLIIGLAVTAGVSRAKAAAVVIGLWAVYLLFKVGAAAIAG